MNGNSAVPTGLREQFGIMDNSVSPNNGVCAQGIFLAFATAQM